MSIPAAWPQVLDFFGMPIVLEPSPGRLSSDAGLLPFRQLDERLGLTHAFAAALNDPRDPELTAHSFTEMVRSRVFGILAGYADQNDHDTLRHDPVFKLVADRSPARPAGGGGAARPAVVVRAAWGRFKRRYSVTTGRTGGTSQT